jgi:hypothetical protein
LPINSNTNPYSKSYLLSFTRIQCTDIWLPRQLPRCISNRSYSNSNTNTNTNSNTYSNTDSNSNTNSNRNSNPYPCSSTSNLLSFTRI